LWEGTWKNKEGEPEEEKKFQHIIVRRERSCITSINGLVKSGLYQSVSVESALATIKGNRFRFFTG
jgi:hypothetical protein